MVLVVSAMVAGAAVAVVVVAAAVVAAAVVANALVAAAVVIAVTADAANSNVIDIAFEDGASRRRHEINNVHRAGTCGYIYGCIWCHRVLTVWAYSQHPSRRRGGLSSHTKSS